MAHRCAILDDYQNVATKLADWTQIPDLDVTVFNEPFADQKAAVAALKGFSIICMMRVLDGRHAQATRGQARDHARQ